jgi:acyl-CoA thioester hydrolase
MKGLPPQPSEPRKQMIHPREVKPSDFPCLTTEKLRFQDLDLLGHVNNIAFNVMSESGRVALLWEKEKDLRIKGHNYVIARYEMDYLGEMHWPGEVVIGSGIKRIGNSSIHVFQGLFQNEKLVATAINVCVLINERTRKGAPWPDVAKAALERNVMHVLDG